MSSLSPPGSLAHGQALPAEVTLAEAARIANCDKKTVVRYLRDGLLEWRDIAPPSSSRPTYRIKLDSVLGLRTDYRHDSPEGLRPAVARATPEPRSARRSHHACGPARPLKHIRFADGE